MKKLYILVWLLAFGFGLDAVIAQCTAGRYYDAVFSADNVTTVQYGSALNWDSTVDNLMVDIYQPTGDNLAHRPLIVFAFGGSFTSGVRESPDLIILSTYFSQRGYVCASIDYRLGYASCGQCDTNLFEALIRGVQDMKGAVRFFYKDAQTLNKYHIDTNNIFIGGVSAGGFIALNYAYFSETLFSKPPPGFALPAFTAVGGIDGNSGNPGYSEKIKGVVDLCGAIADTLWIQPGSPILVGVHGTADNTVACYYDSLTALTNTKSSLFGGGDIKHRLEHINLTSYFYLFQGADHCPFIIPYPPTYNPIPWMDSTEWIVRDFLYQNIVCDPSTTTGIEELASGPDVSIFPNPSDKEVGIYSHYSKDLEVSVLTVDGRTMQRLALPANGMLSLQKADLGTGIYILQFADKGTASVLKTEKIVFQ